ncbi:MAG TPA: undecaprenyldiphospho-muramoylpentapeptide beta-N-acetylglucosaminyltransferase [Acidimicrobiales bacterium]|jgi:undecaprenyldiphospho-muramoylpentapeptide beta-N-acetylglucosaminyltransferase|nr:undecaprenyldiphospho-muramoylpentapeptide beta-N-acetylglucosaminyltransferase [Acidimicrobiales bacterium]
MTRRTRQESGTWAIIAGGGTAGHVLPGLAIAHALVARGHAAASIHFVGSERGIESRLVPDAGFGITVLPGRGIQRRLSVANIGAVVGLVRAIGRAFTVVRRARPAVVVALGGYASVPAALAAVVLRVPVVVAEQNAVPGLANRLVARFAKASAVSFPETDLRRAVVTGNPVRAEVRAIDRERDRARARAAFGVGNRRAVVLAFGGSLGARRINEAVLDAAERWRDRADLTIRHVVGDRDWERDQARIDDVRGRAGPGLQYLPVRYEDDMPTLYAAADLVVCRSGATSVADLTVVGLPSILVPLPGAPGDHQTANARALADAGAAILVPDGQLTGARLVAEVDGLLSEPALLARMATAARSVARPDADARVARLVEEHARG